MSELNHFDVIVVGVGSMGAPACYYLAAAGARVLGIEQFDIPHELGSHGGQSRIIRKAYFEHPDYVPLLQRAYQNWQHLEALTGEQVYYPVGLLYAGPEDHPILRGVRHASALYGIRLDEALPSITSQGYAAVSLPASYDAIFEPDAGFLLPEKAISLYSHHARLHGAVIATHTGVVSWKDFGTGFEVKTTAGTFYAGKLVITSGAWTKMVVPKLKVPLTVTRQVLAWVQPASPESVSLGAMPCWMIADDELPGCLYGFPVLPGHLQGPQGFKLAWHFPGRVCTADAVDRTVTAEDESLLTAFLHKFFPGLYAATLATKTCLYTNSPDEHFIIDYLPQHENRVVVAAGFSGHGFKFASVIGEMLADMVLQGRTHLPVDFLSLKRF